MNTQEKAMVLIVDDNPLTVRTLIDYLQRSEIATQIAKSGEEALRQVAITKPNIILLDILLPGIDGFETCRRLKSNVTTKEIPVIFLTALTETTDKIRAFEVGGVDYITKPFDFKEVTTRINTRLTIQKLQRRLQTKQSFLSSAPQKNPIQEKAAITIVEDNPMTLHVLSGYLEGLGFKTVGVNSGEEALTQVKNSPPDLILLDVLLPGIDGFETCQRLKMDSATKEIPVIFMTALSDTTDKVRAFEAGGADYITKPHHYTEVLARINTHLTIQTLQRQLQKKV